MGLAWVALLAFIRISTNPSIFPAPMTIEHDADVVSYDRDVARFSGIRHRLPG